MYILENVAMDAIYSDRVPTDTQREHPRPAPANKVREFLSMLGGALKRAYFGDGSGAGDVDVVPPHVIPPLL